jgi:ubiquinone/menaquinone biosynthesis C-methylase UbiE
MVYGNLVRGIIFLNIIQILLIIISIIIIIVLIFSLPRKKNLRKASLEGLDDPEVAAAFEKMTNFLPFKILRRKVISHLKSFNPIGVLADVGCGSGNLLVDIAKNFTNLELIGVDISSEVLNLANKRAIESNLNKKIEFKLGKVEDLPFPDNSIDFLISTLSLHHWQNPLQAFREFFRVLKNEGTLIIFDFRRDARKFFYGLLRFATKIVVPMALKKINEPLGSLQAGYTPNEIKQMVSKSPFKFVEIDSFLAWIFIEMRKK